MRFVGYDVWCLMMFVDMDMDPTGWQDMDTPGGQDMNPPEG